MTKVIVSDLGVAIEQLADKLGVAAERLYPLLIKQANMLGWLALAYSVLCLVGIYFIFWWIKRVFLVKDSKGDTRWEGMSEAAAAVHVAVLVIMLVMALMLSIGIFVNTDTAIRALANPEWFALEVLRGKY